jgi:DNA adenine methylase
MMYLGGKNRIATTIAKFIKRARGHNTPVVEPFVGGANVTVKLGNPRYCSDNNWYLIQMWKALQGGWVPPDCVDVDTYKDIRDHKSNYPPELVAYVGFGSFGGRWFAGYPRNSRNTDYWLKHYDSVMAQVADIKGAVFQWCDYSRCLDQLYSITGITANDNLIIYADPPYKGTTQYCGKFDTKAFWQWCITQVERGHIVLVSETQATQDWVSVWSSDRESTLKSSGVNVTVSEKLFIHKTQRERI